MSRGVVVLALVLAFLTVGCSVSWNTVEDGAIENHFGSRGAYTLDGDKEMPPDIAEWSPEGFPGFWLDLKITQGSEAASDGEAKIAASVAATGQGAATGGNPNQTADETDSSTDTNTTGGE